MIYFSSTYLLQKEIKELNGKITWWPQIIYYLLSLYRENIHILPNPDQNPTQ